jgi:hypothetical protein
LTRCEKCRCKIEIPEEYKNIDWLHLSREIAESLINPVLVFLVNSGYTHNVWLCRKCFEKWGKFRRENIIGSWEENWETWLGNRKPEKVQFS